MKIVWNLLKLFGALYGIIFLTILLMLAMTKIMIAAM